MSKDDPRFKEFSVDPRFRSVPKKTKKVKIDPRFKDVFKEKFAGPSISIDKRGRSKKVAGDTGDDLKKFYAMDEGSSSEEEKDEKEEKLDTKNLDWARGETILTDSSSEESDSEEESEDEEGGNTDMVFDKWGELDADADRTDDEATKRLAICNMDWDRVGAKDLYLALSSFLPPSGTLLSVKVYLSDFGAERSQEDNTLGPEELRKNRSKELSEEQMNERVRQYQINRLKYYYAVAEFDSPSSASKIYDECEGMEFELSACRFDLRFVPDDVEFNERDPKETCDSPPENDKYEAKSFETAALQKGKVDLTWDETDPQRAALIQKAFENDDEDNEALKSLINNSDDDDDSNHGKVVEFDEGEEEVVAKYRALLADVKETNTKKDEEKGGGNMQITWNPDAEKKPKSQSKELTPWEQYLEKRKSKQQSKRDARRKSKQAESEQAFSDDDVPDGFDDPFFNQDPFEEDQNLNKKAKNKKKSKEFDEDNPELNLLVMDEEETHHFDYKEIVKREEAAQGGKKKKKSKKKSAREESSTVHEDDFTLDLRDPRFQAIFDDPDYNVDPSHPNFKKTKSMKEIISEKQKRILETDENGAPVKKRKTQISEIDKLVKSVKMNVNKKKGGNKRKRN